jgi:hypothetical protein
MTGVPMALMKLWQQPKQEISKAEIPFKTKGDLFFSALKIQLEKDLLFLRMQKDLGKELFFSQLKISFGQLSSENIKKHKEIKDPKSYLFLYIPGEAGFLIEPNSKIDIFYMYSATKVHQQLGNGTAESPGSPLFILKSNVIGEFKLLDENYVRLSDNGKTLSVAQMSEILLLLADSLN